MKTNSLLTPCKVRYGYSQELGVRTGSGEPQLKIKGRFYKLACDVFAAIVPQVFAFREGAQRATRPNEKQKDTV